MTEAELRNLDARVHREVMGVIWDESRCRVCGWPLVPEGEQGCWASNCSMRPLPERRADELPHYATNIAAAWRIIESLCGPDYMTARFDHGGGTTRCGFYTVHAGRLIAVANADSAPLAICLAALKAVSPKETSPPQKGDCNA